MWPMKPKKDMQSNGSAMLIQYKMSKKQIVPQKDDKNCQSKKYYGSKCSDKNCKENKNIDMWPVKPQMKVQSKKSAMKLIGLASDKNCQATISDKKQKKIDKNCQTSDMRSVTNTNNMWLPKPAIRRLCSDKNWQSIRCYSFKKKSPMRPIHKYDKNCQSV